MQIGIGTSIVRLYQLDWLASTNAHTMVLTDKSIWFLGVERDAGTSLVLVPLSLTALYRWNQSSCSLGIWGIKRG